MAVLNSIVDQEERQVKHEEEHQDQHQFELTETQINILHALEGGTLSRKEVFAKIGIIGDTRASKRHIEPLLKNGFIEMTLADKPRSKLQRYRLTVDGRLAIR